MVTLTTQPRRLAPAASKGSYAEFSTQHSTSVKTSETATPPILVIQEGVDYFLEDVAQLPYKLIRNLGHGHSATVEMVEDVNTGSVFARKVFRFYGSRNDRKRIFNNEIKIIRRLAPHHHVIRVFATYVATREVGLILHPVADGGDLETFLQDFKEAKVAQLVQPEKTKILESSFGCLANGLAFMHHQKIRHKDIKPQNILIYKSSIIYTDFGYSLDHSAIGQSTTTGKPHTFTRKYCAPEVSDWGPRNSKSDIFSLGCVFLEILFVLHKELIPPNPGKSYHDSLEDSQLRSSLQDLNRLGMVTSDMLHPRPEDRPSAEAIASKLWLYESDRFCAKCKAAAIVSHLPPRVLADEPGLNHALDTPQTVETPKTEESYMKKDFSHNVRARQWFQPGEGIARDVIEADIQRYLGPDALVRPGEGADEYEGVQGYWVYAYQNLTSQMVQDLRLDSQRWRAEHQLGRVAYQDSRTHQSRQYYGPTAPHAPPTYTYRQPTQTQSTNSYSQPDHPYGQPTQAQPTYSYAQSISMQPTYSYPQQIYAYAQLAQRQSTYSYPQPNYPSVQPTQAQPTYSYPQPISMQPTYYSAQQARSYVQPANEETLN